MSETKWTPGPWRAVKRNVGSDHALFVTSVISREGFRPWSDADAHLIAAAPELYAALAGLLTGHSSGDNPEQKRGRAALAKARGETAGA